MYSLELLLTVGFAAAIIGLAAGFLIAMRKSPSQQSQRQLESQLSELQQQQQNYQHEVTEHFSETANLVNQLTHSYRDVHSHLAKGAQLLAGEQTSESIKALQDDRSIQNDDSDHSSISPPLDYAPKAAHQAQGMLNEEFGLEKSAERDQESPAVPNDPK